MTTMNLYCGLFSIFASIGGEFEKASFYIFAAILFDTLDGFVARLTNSTSEFGKELDSLCDVVSFGVAPAVMVFMVYLPANLAVLSPRAESIAGMTGSYMAIVFAICAALRLARYNSFQSDRRDSFIGLPSPAAGGTIAAFILFLEHFSQRDQMPHYGSAAYYCLGPLAVLLAILMVSTVLYPKGRFKQFVLKPRRAFAALGFYAFILATLHYAISRSPYTVLFPAAMAYVCFGIGDTLYMRLTRGPALFSDQAGTEETGAEDIPVPPAAAREAAEVPEASPEVPATRN